MASFPSFEPESITPHGSMPRDGNPQIQTKCFESLEGNRFRQSQTIWKVSRSANMEEDVTVRISGSFRCSFCHFYWIKGCD